MSYSIRPLWEIEIEAIKEALRSFNGNITDTARALQISRETLYRKLKAHQINRQDYKVVSGRSG